MMKKLFGIMLFGLLLSNSTISDTQMKSTSTNTGVNLDGKI